MDDTDELILHFQQKIIDFHQDAHKILSTHEGANKSRVVSLLDSYRKLNILSIKQKALFEESLGCAESGHFRSAIIIAWVGFISFLLDKVDVYGLYHFASQGASWTHKTTEELSENHNDYQIIEKLKVIGFCSKNEMKAYQSLLSRRNECAHPSSHTPDGNMALGYISEIFSRIEQLQKRYP